MARVRFAFFHRQNFKYTPVIPIAKFLNFAA